MKLKRKSGIILALDLLVVKSCQDLLDLIYKDVDCVKIGYPLVLSVGINIIKLLKSNYEIPIIADFKVSDIPYISRKIVRITLDAGCDGLLIHGFIGPDGIEACIEEAKEKMIFIITELTSPGGSVFTQPISEDIARMAKELGAYGIQAPGTRPERIKKLRLIVGNELVIISCGIGAQGPSPGSAIRAGADYEIIGRAIYESQDPTKKMIKIKKLIQEAILKRAIT